MVGGACRRAMRGLAVGKRQQGDMKGAWLTLTKETSRRRVEEGKRALTSPLSALSCSSPASCKDLRMEANGADGVPGAIADLKEVLDISQQMRDFTGDHDALGSIADMYTELGDLEQAGKYYDMYLVQLKADEEQEMA